MAVTGSYYIQVFTLSSTVVALGIALGAADIAIMEMFHTVDYQADRSAVPQKRTTIVFLGPERGKIYVVAHVCGSILLFWILTLYHWQVIGLSVMATVSVFFYGNYNPKDAWNIIQNTKKVTWTTIGGGLGFASLVSVWFALLSIPVALGYYAHRKWGKLPKRKK